MFDEARTARFADVVVTASDDSLSLTPLATPPLGSAFQMGQSLDVPPADQAQKTVSTAHPMMKAAQGDPPRKHTEKKLKKGRLVGRVFTVYTPSILLISDQHRRRHLTSAPIPKVNRREVLLLAGSSKE